MDGLKQQRSVLTKIPTTPIKTPNFRFGSCCGLKLSIIMINLNILAWNCFNLIMVLTVNSIPTPQTEPLDLSIKKTGKNGLASIKVDKAHNLFSVQSSEILEDNEVSGNAEKNFIAARNSGEEPDKQPLQQFLNELKIEEKTETARMNDALAQLLQTKNDMDEEASSKVTNNLRKCACYKQMHTFQSQLYTHMPTCVKSAWCEFCMKLFSSRSNLQQHMSKHIGKKFHCHRCTKTFTRNSSLKNHLVLLHEGEKPFKCKICSQCFVQNDLLIQHVSEHTGNEPLSCKICHKIFLHQYQLQNHMVNHKMFTVPEKPHEGLT
ncbi:unnamed protein product [Thelazia callipaeda]|uniref:C2H2-type domain-containing protein n=1 Tax=Thelazia callipaeda TaxID=103827 RepID=A0A0N5CPJ5_THECL|nr:unnamed protein product [Thelazia callipaeda]